MADGEVFERAGVNWSEVYGTIAPELEARLPGVGSTFYATGVSLVLHPRSPMIPTVHANFRFIRKGNHCWFGGGADLTPYYPNREDVNHFHRVLRDGCDRSDPSWYPRFKAWCDSYFYLPHRQETRGVGGIFFDYVGVSRKELGDEKGRDLVNVLEDSVPMEQGFEFLQNAGGGIS